ncbi:hypothetical protein ARHIZOSPH14_28230 [Agromyces rhizosphaerae]|uniref:ER-bound oxygenase mpaB/mpaB'/Rubber oxygenase catalytic domain-containing protein n=2 Tax=Agromyces rhizosphaerae TaxID=88374 RepID=A0A9W6CYZ9_9MICO|nr:hypothetical protein ARHIZOSPH14_28230 [Agromyces rhizosphaerae]
MGTIYDITETHEEPAPKPITDADVQGDERRWRRGYVPVAAGETTKADGTPDYGVFGPDTVVWEVFTHPAMVIFHHAAQKLAQDVYLPIQAAVRDYEPLNKKARAGVFTLFDAMERVTRGAGMHVPLWLGDTATAEHMASWLHKIHTPLKGDVIDSGRPELGGYDAVSTRETLWATYTEMHPMLCAYEAFAWNGWRAPKRLPAWKRDKFMDESANYAILHGADPDEVPHSMAELDALYAKYAEFFAHSETVQNQLDTGESILDVSARVGKKNWDKTQSKALKVIFVAILGMELPMLGALPRPYRLAHGLSPAKATWAAIVAKLFVPVAWFMQRPRFERKWIRTLWGPDGQRLIDSARKVRAEYLAAHPETLKSPQHA